MDNKTQTLNELAKVAGAISSKTALVGLDGFVDKIIKPVDKRTGQGAAFEPIPTITAFGQRILAAAGKSANIELYPEFEKLGGNGPIMANALLSGGMQVGYIGALGRPAIHPVFAEFAKKTNAVSVTDPGVTHALEFLDGKLMLGTMASLDELTFERIIEVMGEGAFLDRFNRADLIAMVNWTMIPNMTAIFHALLTRVLPNLGPRDRLFFFDLADPAKRPVEELKTVLATIGKFQSFGRVTLGLNLAEAQQVDAVLGNKALEVTPENLMKMATRIRQAVGISTVVIHPTHSAACATKEDAFWVAGPYCEKPKITTGAGDHFNAGFTTGQILGLSPAACLTVAVCFSGFYVRNAKGPSLGDVQNFLRQWSSQEAAAPAKV